MEYGHGQVYPDGVGVVNGENGRSSNIRDSLEVTS